MNAPAISICIPTFELGGRGVTMLTKLFTSTLPQLTYFPDVEIVVSDHSQNDDILSLCKKWEQLLPIRYVLNARSRGSCEANLNTAIEHARGKWIKPMLQDDFFLSDEAIAKLAATLTSDTSWAAGGCLHCHEDDTASLSRPHIPRWVPDRSLALGYNLIGSPSVVLFPRGVENHLFDENLLLFMDCELYYRLGKEIGEPRVVPQMLHVIRMRHDSISDSQVTDEIRGEEYRYVLNKLDNLKKPLSDFPILFERAQRLGLR